MCTYHMLRINQRMRTYHVKDEPVNVYISYLKDELVDSYMLNI